MRGGVAPQPGVREALREPCISQSVSPCGPERARAARHCECFTRAQQGYGPSRRHMSTTVLPPSFGSPAPQYRSWRSCSVPAHVLERVGALFVTQAAHVLNKCCPPHVRRCVTAVFRSAPGHVANSKRRIPVRRASFDPWATVCVFRTRCGALCTRLRACCSLRLPVFSRGQRANVSSAPCAGVRP